MPREGSSHSRAVVAPGGRRSEDDHWSEGGRLLVRDWERTGD